MGDVYITGGDNGPCMALADGGKVIPFGTSVFDRDGIVEELKGRGFRVFVQQWVLV